MTVDAGRATAVSVELPAVVSALMTTSATLLATAFSTILVPRSASTATCVEPVSVVVTLSVTSTVAEALSPLPVLVIGAFSGSEGTTVLPPPVVLPPEEAGFSAMLKVENLLVLKVSPLTTDWPSGPSSTFRAQSNSSTGSVPCS